MHNSLPQQPSRVGRYSDLVFNQSRLPSTSLGPLITDWDDVERFIDLSGGPQNSGFVRWKEYNSKKRSADFDHWFQIYKSFRHKALFQLKPEDIVAHVLGLASTPGEHALGTLRAKDQTRLIRDVTPTAPIMLSFHTVLERYARPFTWTEFWQFHLDNEEYFLRCALDKIGISASAHNVDFESSLHLRSIRFRLGMGFYTGWKEAYVLAVLRHRHQLDVRYHFFLDLEWKADLYTDEILVEIFVNNDDMKAASKNSDTNGKLSSEVHGRKTPCSDRNKGKKVLVAAKDAGHKFGACWLHKPTEISWIASRLRAYGCPSIRVNKGDIISS
jgi:hypothetical protein